MDDQLESEKCARYMKALSDPHRLRIVQCLQGGARSVSEIAELLEIDVPNASHHLRVMLHAGLVSTERDGKYIFYSIASDIQQNQQPQVDNIGHLDFGCCRIELGPKSKAGHKTGQKPRREKGK